MKYDLIQDMIVEERYQEAAVLLRLRLREQAHDRVAVELLKLCLKLQEKAGGPAIEDEILKNLDEDITSVEDDTLGRGELVERACAVATDEQLNWKSFLQLILREYIFSGCSAAIHFMKNLPDYKFLNYLRLFFIRNRDRFAVDEVTNLKNWKRKLVFWTPLRQKQLVWSMTVLLIFLLGVGYIAFLIRTREEPVVIFKVTDPLELLQKARSGDPEIQFRVGLNFYYGRNKFEQNRDKGYYWLTQAAKAGHEEAATFLQVLEIKK